MWSFKHKAPLLDIKASVIRDLMESCGGRVGGLYGVDVTLGMDGVRELEKAVKEWGFEGAHLDSYGWACLSTIVTSIRSTPSASSSTFLSYCKRVIQRNGCRPRWRSPSCSMTSLSTSRSCASLRRIPVGLGFRNLSRSHGNTRIFTSARERTRRNIGTQRWFNSSIATSKGKVLRGTDFPVVKHADSLAQVEALNLKSDAREMLLYRAGAQCLPDDVISGPAMKSDATRVPPDEPVYDRRRLREMFKPPSRYATSKVMPLDAAINRHVKAGMTIHFGYTGARPMAASNALVRAFAGTKPEFWVVCAGMVANQASLVSEGLLRKMTVSFVGENYPTASPHRIFQQAINAGAVEIENQSLLVIAQRLAAGASGFPFALTRSLMGSSMEDNPGFQHMDDPFGSGDTIGVVQAIVPDVTIVHGLAADEQGNILISPPFGEGDIVAFAAKTGVIATVERIVSTDVIRANPTLALIPSHRVLSVSEAPMGCHPYAIYNPGGVDVAAYVEDYPFFRDIRTASKTKDDFDRWVREWILDVGCHENYVRKLGADRVQMLRGRSSRRAGRTISRLKRSTPSSAEKITMLSTRWLWRPRMCWNARSKKTGSKLSRRE